MSRELVGDRPATWVKEASTTVCEHFGMVAKGNQWVFRLLPADKTTTA